MFTQLSLDLRMMDFNRFVAGVTVWTEGVRVGEGLGGGWWVVAIQVHTLTCGY